MWHFDIVLVFAMIGTASLVAATVAFAYLTSRFVPWLYSMYQEHPWPPGLYWGVVLFLFCIAATSGLVGACDAVFYFWSH